MFDLLFLNIRISQLVNKKAESVAIEQLSVFTILAETTVVNTNHSVYILMGSLVNLPCRWM